MEDCELYEELFKMVGEARIALLLTDPEESATLVFGEGGIEVIEDLEEPDILLRMERPIFETILKGEADFGALLSRASSSKERLIGLEVLNPERIEALEALRAILLFFTPGRVKRKKLRAELAGEAHGGHPIPLLYWNGVRVAWYLVKEGATLNPEGERDPYPQLFILLNGKGRLRLEEGEIGLEPNTAIYIPPNSLHQLKALEDLKLLWIAWQTP